MSDELKEAEGSSQQIIPVAIAKEVRSAYLTYAMSVIVSRALPDVRDGLKPVHRRILYSMSEMGLHYDRPYKKCGRIVGDVLGKFHPHGDQSIYDALVRLAQTFSLRMPLVQGQGNFGSLDGDPPAAMRYTEARLSKISEYMLNDLKKETVDFVPNYDDSMIEPSVLPAAFPYLLVNGASGIAVGMATNMAPHNLREVAQGVIALIDNPDITIDELVRDYVHGPDFPTSAQIYGRKGIYDAARTGKGRVTLRAKFDIEPLPGDRERIVFSEIPYMVNKSLLMVKIAALVRAKTIEGISDLRDESDKEGIRIVVDVKRGYTSNVVLNQLFRDTQLQSNFNINNLALVNGRPKVCNLKELLSAFIEHRNGVVVRRTQFDLAKAQAREHILLGLKIALDNIDEVVALIRASKNAEEASFGLQNRFSLSEKQAKGVLAMTLQRLTNLETQKIIDELAELARNIAYYNDLLSDNKKILAVIREEIEQLGNQFPEKRRTEILSEELTDVDDKSLIEEEDVVVLLSQKGYIKRVSLSLYRDQNRGGKGAIAMKLKDEDLLAQLLVGSSHSNALFVTNLGRAYWIPVYKIPEGSRYSTGRHIGAILGLGEEEHISRLALVHEFTEDLFINLATERGVVKRLSAYALRNAKQRGLTLITLDEGDSLVGFTLTSSTYDEDLFLVSAQGKALRFPASDVRVTGRLSRGVRGLKLQGSDRLAAFLPVIEGCSLFLMSRLGYGKKVAFDAFTPHGRGTQGQRCYGVSEKTGELVGALSLHQEQSVLALTRSGKSIKVLSSNISEQGRQAFGVRLLRVDEGDEVFGIAPAEQDSEEPSTMEPEK